MKHGVVILMDALGFKGIWQRDEFRNDATKILSALHGVKSDVQKVVEEFREALVRRADGTRIPVYVERGLRRWRMRALLRSRRLEQQCERGFRHIAQN